MTEALHCTITGCTKPLKIKTRGWCSMHYARWERHGDPEKLVRTKNAGHPCSVQSCDRGAETTGLCSMHYQRKRLTGDPEKCITRPNGVALEFIENAATSATDECILWPFKTSPQGYGSLHYKGKKSQAHRVVLEIVTGCVPEGMFACHAPQVCHNPACVNPRHLRWGSPQDNSDDKYLDGTVQTGKSHPGCILSDDDVREIRGLIKSGLKDREIGLKFGVARTTISSIRIGHRRADVAA